MTGDKREDILVNYHESLLGHTNYIMTSTERKLDEALYYLKQLNPHDPYYDYILSAYLNAARSVLWVMRHEYNKANGWEDWYKSCNITDEQKILLKRINDLRILCTKQSGIKTEHYLLDHFVVDEQYYPIIKEMQNIPPGTVGKMTITVPDEDTPEEPYDEVIPEESNMESYKFKVLIKANKEDSESSRGAIHILCNEYFEYLHTIVKSCVEKFVL